MDFSFLGLLLNKDRSEEFLIVFLIAIVVFYYI
jgi:hypothetical protein